jgi:hypothetical protein
MRSSFTPFAVNSQHINLTIWSDQKFNQFNFHHEYILENEVHAHFLNYINKDKCNTS